MTPRKLQIKDAPPQLSFPAWTMNSLAVHDPSKRDECSVELATPADVSTCRYCGVPNTARAHVLSFEKHLELHNAERAGEDPWQEPSLDSFGIEVGK